ncbi:class I SAM-dependent DNA methyltransferase [Streptomyces zagrosensis]|uniref:SAM-dependent methyltransferase n=1 Tax=Streptomyces zagrosensis TaxID=1042984 RepID=A0A7W9QCD3_9ACTN|nr:class I SAM-dependent methyltransferase [Streptomyces zagrosensis]MBB5936427.1 SAM-dependent methyltransferase [Streptomyces zagrosensis]
MTASGPPDYTAFAARYDSWFAPPDRVTEDTVGFLAGLAKSAGPGPALELGIGTGRIALPLAARGVEVHGVDLSPTMVTQLRAKPGGRDIPVTMGDFRASGATGSYALVYVVNGSFAELPTQDAQVDCFAHAARLLRPGGLFALDAHVPEALAQSANGPPTAGQALPTAGGELVLRFREVDRAEQRYRSHYVIFENGASGAVEMHRTTVSFRYAAPSELDLMARMAGLRPRERWADWAGAPFTSASAFHVSVYERAE